MAPVRSAAGPRPAERSILLRGILPTVVLAVLILGGLPTTGADHAALTPSTSSVADRGAELLAEAHATPLPATAPTTASPHPAASGGPQWTDLQSKITNQVPAYRYIGTMDYDPIDQYVVLFGGYGNGSATPYSDTWTYANGRWNELDISGPPARYAAMMTWDAGDGYMLLFGGYDSSTAVVYNDTWTFVHGAWTQLSPTTSPPARWRGAMAYDAADNYTVLFGGTPTTATTAPMKDTWEYKAGAWTNVTTTVTGNPSARFRQDMTYDAADKYLVMFGGCTTSACSSQDTWTFRNGTWTFLNPATKPEARTYTGLTYDAAQGYVLMFGGVDEATNTGLDDTWEFLNGNWTDLTSDFTTQPSTRGLEMMTYDPLDGYTLLFGGQNPSTVVYDNDTWAFGPSVIGRVSVAPSTVDLNQPITVNATPLAYAGYASFNYSGLPPGCTNANVSVINCTPTSTGNYSISVAINDSSGLPTTKNVSVTVNPDLVLTSVVANPTTVTVGSKFHVNVTAEDGTTPYSYSYTGLPAGCSSGNTASLSCTPTASGTVTITATASDAVGWNESGSVSVTVNPVPSLVALVASPGTLDLGSPLTLWANATGGTPPLTWTYTGLPIGCSSTDAATFTCTPTLTGTFGIHVNVTDAFGWAASRTTTITVNSAPSITGFAVSPGSVDLGQTVSIWLNGTGGTGVLSDAYAGLPPGCSFGHLVHATCVPTINGTFVITGTVTDSLGVVATQTITLTIGADPAVNSVTVSPLRVDAGQTVTITVAVTGGTAPFAYVYTGLPTGCSNTTTSVVTCRPTTAGTFDFVAQATDVWHVSSQLGAQLTVDAAPSVTGFTASVSPVTVGSTTILQTTVSGGSGVFTYVYTHLPSGCTSQNKSSLSCTPTATGTFNVTVTVTDTFGRTTSSSTSFVVQPSSSSSSFLGFSGSTGYLLVAVIVVVVLLAIVALALMMRRRGGSTNAPPAEEWQEPPPEDEPPPA
jgi:hypothetical protein